MHVSYKTKTKTPKRLKKPKPKKNKNVRKAKTFSIFVGGGGGGGLKFIRILADYIKNCDLKQFITLKSVSLFSNQLA